MNCDVCCVSPSGQTACCVDGGCAWRGGSAVHQTGGVSVGNHLAQESGRDHEEHHDRHPAGLCPDQNGGRWASQDVWLLLGCHLLFEYFYGKRHQWLSSQTEHPSMDAYATGLLWVKSDIDTQFLWFIVATTVTIKMLKINVFWWWLQITKIIHQLSWIERSLTLRLMHRKYFYNKKIQVVLMEIDFRPTLSDRLVLHRSSNGWL